MTGLVPSPPDPHARFTLAKKYRVYADWIKRLVYNRIFPLPLRSLWFAMLFMTLLHAVDVQWVMDATAVFEAIIIPVVRFLLVARLISICIFTFIVWYSFVVAVRCTITCILMYKGYLSETPGKVSLTTKMFMGVIHMLWKCKPKFLSFQDLLPALPLPSVNHSVSQYLESIRPLLNEKEFAEKQKLADEFVAGPASKLQRALWLKWLTSPNYVTDLWKEYGYLKWSDSLINTQCAGLDVIYKHHTKLPAARGANIVIMHHKFKEDTCRKENMKPISLAGIPMCNAQYIWSDRNLRRAGLDGDTCVPAQKGRHIAVFSKGCWYVVPMYVGRRLVRAVELEKSLETILAADAKPDAGEEKLSSLTLCDRKRWARVREEYFMDGLNKESLAMIESAAEILIFDDEEFIHDENDISKIERWYQRTLHNDGYKNWADVPSCTIVSKNGKYSAGGEHSACDALIYVHSIEYYKYNEQFNPHFMYDKDGHCQGQVEHVPAHTKLRWQMAPELLKEIQEAYQEALTAAADVTNAALITKDLGKSAMKKANCSPDAFIQMALQLTYYKDQQKFGLTYEAGMTRLFKEGRTDTIRSVTPQSCKFVRAMCDDKCEVSERLSLLRQACSSHQAQVRRAMCGQACDRHLFAMYIVSKGLGIEAPFLKDVLAQPWKLSTSQAPQFQQYSKQPQTPQHQQQEHRKALNSDPALFWPAGAFMAPAGSDYGVCYTIGECGNRLSFHISAHASDQHTDPQRFRDLLRSVLLEMKELADNEPKFH